MEKIQHISVAAVVIAFVALTITSTTITSINRLDKRIDGLSTAANVPATPLASSSTSADKQMDLSQFAGSYGVSNSLGLPARRADKAAAMISSHPFCGQSMIHYESCTNQIESIDKFLTTPDTTLEHVLNSSLMQGPTDMLLTNADNVVTHAGNLYSHLIGTTLPIDDRNCQGKATGLCVMESDFFGNASRLVNKIDMAGLFDAPASSSTRSRRGFFSWASSLFSGNGANSGGSAVSVSGSGAPRSAPPSSSSGVLSMPTTGASAATARGEGYSAPGAATSASIVRRDEGRLSNYKEQIMSASHKYNVPPEIIGGVMSRETHAGGAIGGKWNGYGDGGHAFGLMQVDKRYHTPATSSVQASIDQGTQILSQSISAVSAKHPDWPRTKQIQGGVAAYNSGPGNIQTQGGIDIGTTHNDYSNDVVARAQALHQDGFFN